MKFKKCFVESRKNSLLGKACAFFSRTIMSLCRLSWYSMFFFYKHTIELKFILMYKNSLLSSYINLWPAEISNFFFLYYYSTVIFEGPNMFTWAQNIHPLSLLTLWQQWQQIFRLVSLFLTLRITKKGKKSASTLQFKICKMVLIIRMWILHMWILMNKAVSHILSAEW